MWGQTVRCRLVIRRPVPPAARVADTGSAVTCRYPHRCVGTRVRIGMVDVDQFEEAETDSTIDQQLNVVVEDEETASVAEEIVEEAERSGLTSTPQVPVLSSSASGQELGLSVVACLRHPPGYTGMEPSWLANRQLWGRRGPPSGSALARGPYRQ